MELSPNLSKLITTPNSLDSHDPQNSIFRTRGDLYTPSMYEGMCAETEIEFHHSDWYLRSILSQVKEMVSWRDIITHYRGKLSLTTEGIFHSVLGEARHSQYNAQEQIYSVSFISSSSLRLELVELVCSILTIGGDSTIRKWSPSCGDVSSTSHSRLFQSGGCKTGGLCGGTVWKLNKRTSGVYLRLDSRLVHTQILDSRTQLQNSGRTICGDPP